MNPELVHTPAPRCFTTRHAQYGQPVCARTRVTFPRRSGDVVVATDHTSARDAAIDHHRAAATTEATPAAPEDQRQNQPDIAHDHQDQPEGVDVDAADVCVYGEIEDRPDGDQEQA